MIKHIFQRLRLLFRPANAFNLGISGANHSSFLAGPFEDFSIYMSVFNSALCWTLWRSLTIGGPDGTHCPAPK
jgi:hypothetical protein